MARQRKGPQRQHPQTERSGTQDTPSGGGGSGRDPVVDAFLSLLAERPFEEVGFGDIAARAGISLADLRGRFGSTLAILAAHLKEIDRQVLSGIDAEMAEEPARERLFDVLMRRLEALTPYKAAARSLTRSFPRNPGLALAFNAMAVRSQQWMLTAADIPAAGPKGIVRAQGLAMLFSSVLRTWLHDDDPGLARTMAALDRALARGQRWAGYLDDLCRIPETVCRLRPRRRRDRDDEEAAAA
jgi:AcrR family transcriptional regulator